MSYGNGPGYGHGQQPPAGGGYGQQPPPGEGLGGSGFGQWPQGGGGYPQSPPPNHLVWAIITLFCCQIMGIVSIIFAAQVNGKFQRGDYAGAVDSSNKAKIFAMIGTILGVVQVIGVIVYGVTVSTGTTDSGSTPSSVTTPGYTASAPAHALGKCSYLDSADQSAPKDLGRPVADPIYKGTVGATIKTSLGDISMSLDADKAPCSVGSFAFLAQKNYFDNTQCHRLTSGALRVLQCGDPTGTGAGGPGYRFANENTTGATYTRGVLAMANTSQPASNGSQFFIVYGDSKDLPPDYTVFGQVTSSGLDVIDQVANAGSDDSNGPGDGKPKKKIEINDVLITPK